MSSFFIFVVFLAVSLFYNLKQAQAISNLKRMREADFQFNRKRKETPKDYKSVSLIQRAYNDHYQI